MHNLQIGEIVFNSSSYSHILASRGLGIMSLEDYSTLLLLAAGALSGLVIHHGLFIHGEWHIQAPNIVRCYGSVFLFALAGGLYYQASPLHVWFDGLLLAFLAHVVSLLSSIITYRVFFHRLTREDFPGPLPARITKLWHVWQARGSKNFLVLDRLNAKYGDFVRTGPSEVTVFVPEAFSIIDSRHSICTKAEWYDLLHPEKALVATRDKTAHNDRRKDWLYAFTSNGESRVPKRRVLLLTTRIPRPNKSPDQGPQVSRHARRHSGECGARPYQARGPDGSVRLVQLRPHVRLDAQQDV